MTTPPPGPDPQANQPYGAQPPYGGPPPAGNPYGPPTGGYAVPGGPGMSSPGSPGGFFAALFDFSFSKFITPMIIRFVYILATVCIAGLWLLFVILGFADSAGMGLFALILGPVFALIYLAFIRMTLEIYLAVVRMSEDIHQRLPRS